MTNRKQLAARTLASAALLASLCLDGCGTGAESEPPSSGSTGEGGTAIVAIGDDIRGINPLTATSETTREIHDQLFLRLFEEQADYGEHPPSFEPELAESFDWSKDGKELTLTLRSGVLWSDGEPVTAHDVAWTLSARADPAIAWTHSDSQERIESWEALDDRTIVVRFRHVYPDQLEDLNQSPILPRHAWGRIPFDQWRQSDDWFRDHLVVSGPFDLAEWRRQDRWILARNPRYYRPDLPKLARVAFRVVPEKSNQLEQLLAGQIDFVRALRPSTAERVERSDAARIVSIWHRQYAFLMWNGCRPPFDDPLVRRAMTLALDRESIREAVYGEYARLAVSPILSTLWAFNREIEPWPYDAAEASRLLDSRGWRDRDGDGVRDRDGEPLEISLSTNAGNRMRLDIITMAQSQLAEVGVRAELEPIELGAWMERNRAHDFDAAAGSWLPDTSLDLHYIFHSESSEGGRGNWGCYENPEVDRLIEEARSQTAAGGKLEPLLAIQEIVHREQPYTFLFELKRINGVSRRMRDVRPTSLHTFANLEEWWIDSAG